MSASDAAVAIGNLPLAGDTPSPCSVHPSAWSMSAAKRAFDLAMICVFAPIVAPLIFIGAVAVWLSSPGPILFKQARIGANGRPFTIFKFRTMIETPAQHDPGIACTSADRITGVGHLLRKLKLDELPQIFNVLRGDMSLVGPRPRIASQQFGTFACRPGVTGAATLVFAREDLILAELPPDLVLRFYVENITPAKHRMDSEYMARATMLSDLLILLRTAVGRWDAPPEGPVGELTGAISGLNPRMPRGLFEAIEYAHRRSGAPSQLSP